MSWPQGFSRREMDSNPSIDFFLLHTFDVHITHPDLGDIGRATLTFGNGSQAHLEFDDISSVSRLAAQRSHRELLATSRFAQGPAALFHGGPKFACARGWRPGPLARSGARVGKTPSWTRSAGGARHFAGGLRGLISRPRAGGALPQNG